MYAIVGMIQYYGASCVPCRALVIPHIYWIGRKDDKALSATLPQYGNFTQLFPPNKYTSTKCFKYRAPTRQKQKYCVVTRRPFVMTSCCATWQKEKQRATGCSKCNSGLNNPILSNDTATYNRSSSNAFKLSSFKLIFSVSWHGWSWLLCNW